MENTLMKLYIDEDIEQKANAIFSTLGLALSGAVKLLLSECVHRGEIPFSLEVPRYSEQTLEAMAEARQISHDSLVQGFTSMNELKSAPEADV